MPEPILTVRDLDMLKNGRNFEREDIIKQLEKIAKESLRGNPEHALHIGFIVQAIKAMTNE